MTRGVRQPFQIAGGLERLLEAYAARPEPHPQVTREQVRLHELCVAAQWCKDALAARADNRKEPVSEAVARSRRVLDMASRLG